MLSIPRPRIPHGVNWVLNTPPVGTENGGQFQSHREAGEAH